MAPVVIVIIFICRSYGSSEFATDITNMPSEFVPADNILKLLVLSNGTVLLPNGTQHRGELLLSRAESGDSRFEKLPRGFLVAVEDAEYWQDCLECFKSISVVGEDENAEQWFSEDHIHDSQAL